MNMFEKIGMWFMTLMTLFTLWLIIIVAIDGIFWIGCEGKYEETQYGFFKGCMVEYNGEYIPEDLYEQAFTKNINLITK